MSRKPILTYHTGEKTLRFLIRDSSVVAGTRARNPYFGNRRVVAEIWGAIVEVVKVRRISARRATATLLDVVEINIIRGDAFAYRITLVVWFSAKAPFMRHFVRLACRM